MKQLLQKLIKGVAYFAAAIVIVLAIAVGIFRLMLPRLPEYQEEIKTWASNAIGMRVDFAGMNARWRLSGPELSFFETGLGQIGSDEDVLTAGEVSIGVGLLRLITDRELVVDRVSIRNTNIDLRQDENGNWLVQGMPLDEIIGARSVPAAGGGKVEVVGQNVEVSYEHPASGQVVPLMLRSISVMRDPHELRVEADLDLPEEFGDRLELSANQLIMDGVEDTWRIFAEADSINLAGVSRLRPVGLPGISAGSLDLSIWMDLGLGGVLSATANLVVDDLLAETEDVSSPFSVQGSFEYSSELDGWLLAASQLRVSTASGDWPQSSFQVRVIEGADGEVTGLRADSGYFDLDDIRYVQPWLPTGIREQIAAYAPSGILRGVSVELIDIGTDNTGFDISADLEEAGIAAVGELPGFRNLSGGIRADRDGGRVEIESAGLSLDLGQHLAAPLDFDAAMGTVIWRRNREGMTILSDSVRIRNADLDSQMNLQVTLPGGDEAPFIDFESTWTVSDLSTMYNYLPVQLISPNLRQWLTDAMVGGRISRGTTQVIGSLDKFPFDDGDGVFRIEARLEDATLLYSPKWPAPTFNHLDLIVDKMRLYSVENSAINLGNSVEDARIEIPDLRRPVLGIEAFATGTLESIRTYAQQSPIDGVLGGQLDRVEVDGDASFDLSITYPIQDKENYDFSTRIRMSDGLISVTGFPAPISELNGDVLITREDVSSESLFGQFLGYPVDLQLDRIRVPDSPHSVVVEATGSTTADALQSEFRMPLSGVIDGDADYRATMRFPNAQAPQPGYLQVMVESDLFGFQSNLPRPLDKSDDEALPLSLNIEFPSSGQIVAAGSLAGEVNWTARFVRQEEGWDFDRGVLAVGGVYPDYPDTRGLHIQGQAADIDLHAWLAEGRRGNKETGLGDRIRSIDLNVGHFHAVGQLFTDHRILVNRSGQDWLIQLDGEQARGTVTVPYQFTGDRPMTLEMERLVLPGDGEEEGLDADPLDPRSLPAISIRADEFAFGERFFGRLEADFERTERGLESAQLVTRDDSFALEGSAGWIIDAYEETGQRTYFDAVLKSTDVRQTSQRLNYDPGVSSSSMEIDLEVGWAGGPRDDFLSVLNGNVGVTLGAGRLTEVEPGAGRVFGLMSFVALPRRLALDFSDVFDTGFSFDQITGSFRITNGDAYTCDLTLTGPAADVGIVGRTGLNSRDYNQSVIVSANVGNTLPVVGLFTGGPQVAAALLVFSQLFKKPLKDMGQVYYAVDGSWDEPVIGNSSSQHFADISGTAGCINPNG